MRYEDETKKKTKIMRGEWKRPRTNQSDQEKRRGEIAREEIKRQVAMRRDGARKDNKRGGEEER